MFLVLLPFVAQDLIFKMAVFPTGKDHFQQRHHTLKVNKLAILFYACQLEYLQKAHNG